MNNIEHQSKWVRYLRIYLRAFQLIWNAGSFNTLITLVAIVFSAISVPVQVWISKLVIDRISQQLRQSSQVDWQQIITPIAVYLGIWLLGAIFHEISASFQQATSLKIGKYAQSRLLQKASKLSVAFYENPTYYDRLELANSQIYRFENVPYILFTLISQFISLVSLLVLLGQVSILLPLILVLTALPKMIAHSKWVNRDTEFFLQKTSLQRKLGYIGDILASREMVKEVRLFRLQDYFLKQFNQKNKQYVDAYTRLRINREKAVLPFTLPSLLGLAFAWFYTIYRAILGQVSLGDIALVFQSAEQSRFALDEFFSTFGYLIENGIYLENYFAFLDQDPEKTEGALVQIRQAHGDVSVPNQEPVTIEFDHVSFGYPGAEQPVLHDVSFTIERGQSVALVGENGAGKTTIVKLLARLYDPTGGQILVNGKDLRTYDPEEYYNCLGVIMQDFVRYDLPVRENIGLGNIDAIDDLARIRQASEKGGALSLVEQFPQAFDTVLGKRFEGGVDLSGGEWQKIALSRAFMRDASLLILDEPTAALDAYAENQVFERFAELTRGKTTVFVTHRLSSVTTAQKILVIQKGRLVEMGTHKELMQQNAEYARMFTLQAERYQQE